MKTETLTDEMIRTLRTEANAAGDVDMAEAAKAALAGNTHPRLKTLPWSGDARVERRRAGLR